MEKKEQQQKKCSWCSAPAVVRCGRCKDPYCSAQCQRQHWPYHKVWCRTAEQERAARERAEEEGRRDHVREAFRMMPDENDDDQVKPLGVMMTTVQDASGTQQTKIVLTTESLPNEVLVRIFEKLDEQALVAVTRVSRTWRNLALAEEVLWWRHLVSAKRLRKIERGLRPPPTADELRDSFSNFMKRHCTRVIAARNLRQQRNPFFPGLVLNNLDYVYRSSVPQ